MDSATKQKYRDYLDSELEAVHMYTALAEAERDPERAQIFRDLVDVEMRHAAKWADKLGLDPAALDPGRRGLKPRLLKLGATVFGTNKVLPVLLRLEADEIDAYAGDPEAADILDEELDHTAKLANMAGVSMEEITLKNERTHRVGLGGLGNNLRAAVMGMNDAPRALCSEIISFIKWTFKGSSPENGSSRMMRSGPCMSAPANCTS